MKKLLYIFLSVALLTACKTTKTVQKTTGKETSRVAELIEKVKKTQPQFTTANVSKMSVSFNLNNREVNVSASCKIKKDSLIHLSIQPFMGIEMFKAEFSTDSIRVFDKMNRNYYVVDYASLSNRFGVNVDFFSLQNLLFNQFFCIGRKTIVADSCKLVALSNAKNGIEYQDRKMKQETELSATNQIEKVTLSAKGTPYQLNVDYAGFSSINGINFPQEISMLISNQRTKVTSLFTISKIEFNNVVKFTDGNPSKFTRSDINKLLKKQ